MNKDVFTEEELDLLKLIFELAETLVYNKYVRENCYDSADTLYEIKEKLGISDIV